MTKKEIKIGFDRFIKLKWADYAFELYLSALDEEEKYQALKTYLQHEIEGVETARKTANQLKRLWLSQEDGFQGLRESAASVYHQMMSADLPIIHFGMLLNVSPVFRETNQRIGELSAIQQVISPNSIISRVSQSMLSPSSIPRVVSRVIQTLADWNILEAKKEEVRLREISITDPVICSWFIRALMTSEDKREISIHHLAEIPIKLGIRFVDLRSIIQNSDQFMLRRNASGEDLVVIV
jgi:hypothetical protein